MKGTAILALASTVLLCACGLQAQTNAGMPEAQATYADSTATSTPSFSGEPQAASPDGGAAPQANPQGGTAQSPAPRADQWHLSVSPYFWLAGVHGSLGAFDRDASFRASPWDILSHFRFGLAGVAEARHNRLLLPIDLMWIRLEATNALPFPPALAETSATVKATEFILSPKVGLRLIDTKMIKGDALAGIRYWYFGENLQFRPSRFGLNFSHSQNWVDPVVGGRIEGILSPKVSVTIAGDVGGWGVGSQLDYQVVGVLGYKVKPHVTLQGGWRYLYVDYTTGGRAGAFVNLATSGAIFGATINLK